MVIGSVGCRLTGCRLGDSRLSKSRLSGMRPKYGGGGGQKELALMHGKADMDKDCVKGCLVYV